MPTTSQKNFEKVSNYNILNIYIKDFKYLHLNVEFQKNKNLFIISLRITFHDINLKIKFMLL